AMALLLLLFFVPESPRWLTEKGHVEKARHILTRVDGPAHAEGELNEIQTALAQEPATLREIVAPGLRVALLIGVVLAVLQQITGINVMLYYGPEIFKNAGQSIDTSLVWTIAMGGCMVLFTCVAIWTVDKLGRKPLMIAGATGMGLCLIATGVAFCADKTGLSLLIFILGYIAFFSLSVGPVTWVILSEIFPTKIRGRAMAIATFCLWVANFIISQTFPMMDENPWLIEKFNHGFPFFVYGGFCVVLVLFMIAAVPETKGKTLEAIEQRWL
ncbi:MAG: sugar porter family MFS transporter, partial [Planctomycetota bacterium]